MVGKSCFEGVFCKANVSLRWLLSFVVIVAW